MTFGRLELSSHNTQLTAQHVCVNVMRACIRRHVRLGFPILECLLVVICAADGHKALDVNNRFQRTNDVTEDPDRDGTRSDDTSSGAYCKNTSPVRVGLQRAGSLAVDRCAG